MIAAVTISGRTGTFLSLGPSVTASLMAAVATGLIWYVSGRDGYNVAAIYAGVLSLLSIFSGFLATFYVFVATRSNTFLVAIRHTATFRELISLLRFTLLWTLGTCALTLVMSVVEPKDFELTSVQTAGIAVWVWSVSMIMVNFWRCTQMFIRSVEAPR